MRATLLPLVLFVPAAHAQVFDHVLQPGLEGHFGKAVRTSAGTWALASHQPQDNSFFSNGTFTMVDDEGTITAHHSFSVPGNELTAFSTIAEIGTDTFLLAGTTAFGCDFGPFMGLLVAWHGGGPLWVRTFGDETSFVSFERMAVGDSTVILSHDQHMLVTTLAGDSLGSTFVGNLSPRSIRAIGGQFLAATYQGVHRFEQDGTPAGQWAGAQAFDIAPHPDGGYLVLTSTGVQKLSSGMTPEGTPLALDIPTDGSIPALDHVDGLYYVITSSQIITLAPSLLQVDQQDIGHPDGYLPYHSHVADGRVFTSGIFTCGVMSAAYRCTTLDGIGPIGNPDIALSGIEHHDMQYSVTPSGAWQHVSVQTDISCWLVNRGDVPIGHATLNYIFPIGTCGPAGMRYEWNGPTLLPGDSVWLTIGPLGNSAYVGQEVEQLTLPICIWAASPGQRMDTNRSDNRGCVDLLVPVGIAAYNAPPSLAVHPNPFSDRFTVTGLPVDARRASLIDAAGREVRNVPLDVHHGYATIDPGNLPPGIYRLVVHVSNGRWGTTILRTP